MDGISCEIAVRTALLLGGPVLPAVLGLEPIVPLTHIATWRERVCVCVCVRVCVHACRCGYELVWLALLTIATSASASVSDCRHLSPSPRWRRTEAHSVAVDGKEGAAVGLRCVWSALVGHQVAINQHVSWGEINLLSSHREPTLGMHIN